LVEPVKDTATSEIATDITETPIQHARKRALSGQQIQAEKLMRTTKRKLSEFSVGDESAISTDISEADTDFNIPSAEAFQSTSSLVTTEIAPNSEETPVVQILNPNNSDNDVQLVEPVKDTATSEMATDITETPIQHARWNH
jgi:hypothetical protein